MRLAFNGSYPISNHFGIYDPSAYARYPGMKHPGTDFVTPADTPLVAGMSGRVSIVRSTARIGRGNEVIITNKNRQRKSCHMNRIDVADGQWVNEGDSIGLSGYTGYVVDAQGRVGTAGGAHLHDELLIDSQYVDLMEHLTEEDNMPAQDRQVRLMLFTILGWNGQGLGDKRLNALDYEDKRVNSAVKSFMDREITTNQLIEELWESQEAKNFRDKEIPQIYDFASRAKEAKNLLK